MLKFLQSIVLLSGFLFMTNAGNAQGRQVTGTILSQNDNSPLPGVTVTNRNTNQSTTTNANGTFTINADRGHVLVLSYVGFVERQLTVGDAASLNVTLAPNQNSLGEVVVTAHGINRNKKTLGYSTPTVEGEDVTRTQRESFIQGLAARVPGLQINGTSGQPGASSQIVLRGIVSLDGDNSPLIVIDGLPISNSTYNQTANAVEGTNRRQDYSNRAIDINPADIESYVILKGPEATALYGNMGASGAIVITTKKARAQKGTVTYNNSFRVEKLTRFPEVQTVYNQGSNGVFANTINTTTGYRTYFGPRYAPGTKIYDNISDFFQTGFTQKHNLSFEGGTGGFSYRWSNEYTDQEGTIPNTALKRISSRITAVGAISEKLRLTSSFTYVNTTNRKANKGDRGYLISLLNFPVWADASNYIDTAGNRVLTTTNGTIFNENDNPYWDVNKNFNEDRTNRFLANTNLSFRPLSWLNFQGALGADVESTNGVSVLHTQSYLGSGSATTPRGGIIEPYLANNRIINGSLTGTATHKFGDFNNQYIIGTNFNDYKYQTDAQYGQNMYDPNFYSINNTLPTTQRTKTTLNRYRNFGVFAQTVLGYKTIAFLTLSGRMDAASRLMPNDPYFFYPAVSFAYNFSDMGVFKEYRWLSRGKLRASYAYTGKEPRTPYVTKSRFVPQSFTGGGFAYTVTGGNTQLAPEFTKNLELGTEIFFFNNRLGIDFTWYSMRSEDQIVAPRLSYGTGFVLKNINGGVVTNKGIEIQLTGSPVRSNDINWDVIVNFTRNKGTVAAMPAELPEFYHSDTWLANGVRSSSYKGISTGSLGGFVYQRNKNNELVIDPSTGRPILESATDYLYMGDRTPDFSIGLSNSLSWKNIDFSFLLDFRKGGDVYNATEYMLYTQGLSTKTLDREVPRIIPGVLRDGLENSDNPTRNNITIIPYYNNAYYSPATELFVERDINWLRLRDVTLQYTFPRSLLSRQKLVTDFSVFVTGTDVFLITNYSGIDPDSNGNTAGVGGFGGYGIDFGNTGRPMGVNFGLRLKL